MQTVAHVDAEPIQFPTAGRRTTVQWDRLTRHLQTHYHEPDIEGVRVVASAAAAHSLWPEASPVWLMLIGPAGTGKSSLVGPVVAAFPDYYALSNLTPSTLVSGWAQGKRPKSAGLLSRLGPSILFWISDLSSITGMQEAALTSVASQFREVYDGRIAKDVGIREGGYHDEWAGKATMLVGATRAVERRWALLRDLGERFLYIRWRTGDPEELARAAGLHDHETALRDETTQLTSQILDSVTEGSAPFGSDAEMERLELPKLAALVARLRQAVIRERGASGGPGRIVDVADSEGPGRIMKTLYQVQRAHAWLNGRSSVSPEDVAIGARVARDSIPLARAHLLQLVRQSGRSVTKAELLRDWPSVADWNISASALDTHLKDLAAIRLLTEENTAGENWYSLSEWVTNRYRLLEAK